MELCTSRRAVFVEMKYLTPTRATLIYEMPLAEVRSLEAIFFGK